MKDREDDFSKGTSCGCLTCLCLILACTGELATDIDSTPSTKQFVPTFADEQYSMLCKDASGTNKHLALSCEGALRAVKASSVPTTIIHARQHTILLHFHRSIVDILPDSQQIPTNYSFRTFIADTHLQQLSNEIRKFVNAI